MYRWGKKDREVSRGKGQGGTRRVCKIEKREKEAAPNKRPGLEYTQYRVQRRE